MPNESELRERVEQLERQVATYQGYAKPGVRKQSERMIWGMPLWAVATGPDPEKGERIGHARGFFAFGDMATGVFAFGGIARGLFTAGGVALGGISLGGCTLGILLGIGGLATGLFAGGGLAIGGVAVGGGAIGCVAVGGGSVGYYATGGGAVGQYVMSPVRQDPEAVQFFTENLSLLPGVSEAFADLLPDEE